MIKSDKILRYFMEIRRKPLTNGSVYVILKVWQIRHIAYYHARHRQIVTLYGAVKASTGILKHGKRVVRAKSL